MADPEAYDFAAHTRLDLDQPASAQPVKRTQPAVGPSFALPAKLEPFVLLAKSARGGGAAALISQAVAAPGVYVFSELLEQQSVKDLASNEQHQQQYRLLELFAYGTWGDFAANRDSYPGLTPDQETKLKQLSVLTLATQGRNIPYSTLLSTLSLPDVPALEDLLISCFYADILTGRLDQKAQRLEVLTAHGRDVRPAPSAAPAAAPPAAGGDDMQVDSTASTSTPGANPSASGAAPSVPDLTASLTSFLSRLSNLLASLDQHLSTLHAAALNTASVQQAHEEKVRARVEEVQKSGGGGGKGGKGGAAASAFQSFAAGGVGGSSEGMDVDSGPGYGGAGGSGGGGPREMMSPGGGGGGSGGRARKRGRN
ncbi:hypothetical protein JCM8097_001549 [Rhodosporidiobolus ruineniae]